MKNTEKDYLWLIWFQNTETGVYTSFHNWANNPDEALTLIAEDFFNSSCPSITIGEDYIMRPALGDKTIDFPSEKMKALSIQKFKIDEYGKMRELRDRDGSGKYTNKKKE